MDAMLIDGEVIEIVSRGNAWRQSWHAGATPPDGAAHGSAGLCMTDAGEVVVISVDGVEWDFPAGRPDPGEEWEATLRREVMEEACARVTTARLLGFARGACIAGSEAGKTLVRSIWLARVELLPWTPQFEIRHRRLVPPADALATTLPEYRRFWERVFSDAGLRAVE